MTNIIKYYIHFLIFFAILQPCTFYLLQVPPILLANTNFFSENVFAPMYIKPTANISFRMIPKLFYRKHKIAIVLYHQF